VPVSDVAWTRFAVRYGELSFGERCVDAFKGLGGDQFPLMSWSPEMLLPLQVVEIVDQRDQRVLRRDCLDAERAGVLFDAIARTLAEVDVTTFERTWLTAAIPRLRWPRAADTPASTGGRKGRTVNPRRPTTEAPNRRST
jgi:hypothetical protein